MDVFRVKPLEWEKDGRAWRANTIFGTYAVIEREGYVRGIGPLSHDRVNLETVGETKAAMERWYRDRLAPALEVVELKSEA